MTHPPPRAFGTKLDVRDRCPTALHRPLLCCSSLKGSIGVLPSGLNQTETLLDVRYLAAGRLHMHKVVKVKFGVFCWRDPARRTSQKGCFGVFSGGTPWRDPILGSSGGDKLAFPGGPLRGLGQTARNEGGPAAPCCSGGGHKWPFWSVLGHLEKFRA